MKDYLFYTLYNISPIYRNRLVQLIHKFTFKISDTLKNKIYDMINTRANDEEIVKYISSIVNYDNSTMNSKKRAQKFALQWKSVMDDTICNNIKINKYLDIGCNNGYITVEFGKIMGLHKDNIYGIDVESFTFQNIKPISGFTFNYYDGYKIPFDDNTFDFITCIMVLHHIKYPNVILSEMRRVLKQDGVILIKEHNIYDEPLIWLTHLEHLLYDSISYNILYNDFINNYYFNGFTKSDIKKMFTSYGFRKISIKNNDIIDKYYSYNPTKHYYYLWKKEHI